jgi:hypothetical protein
MSGKAGLIAERIGVAVGGVMFAAMSVGGVAITAASVDSAVEAGNRIEAAHDTGQAASLTDKSTMLFVVPTVLAGVGIAGIGGKAAQVVITSPVWTRRTKTTDGFDSGSSRS